MTISQGVLLIKYENGFKKWWRISRQNINNLDRAIGRINGLHYAKLYELHKKGKQRNAGRKLAYWYFKNGMLKMVIE